MNREEAKQNFYRIIESGVIDFNEKNIIDKIYDDLEFMNSVNDNIILILHKENKKLKQKLKRLKSKRKR